MNILDDTPVEKYLISNSFGESEIFVKREDKCISQSGPPFSKIRGLKKHLEQLKSEGITTVGYTETSISMAGWGVVWVGYKLGLKTIIFDPQYKKTINLLEKHREQWKKWKAQIIPIPAGRAKVNYYLSRNIMKKYPNSILLPLGLPLKETIKETSKITKKTLLKLNKISSIVVNVGSGTICSGIIKGSIDFKNLIIYGITGRKGSLLKKREYIIKGSGMIENGLFSKINLIIEDSGYEYSNRSFANCPFPSHPYYDLKAWEWLLKNFHKIPSPVLFWNIGSCPFEL